MPFGTLRLAASRGLGLAQMGQQLASQFAARQGIERGVDRLMRDPQAEGSSMPFSIRVRRSEICSGD